MSAALPSTSTPVSHRPLTCVRASASKYAEYPRGSPTRFCSRMSATPRSARCSCSARASCWSTVASFARGTSADSVVCLRTSASRSAACSLADSVSSTVTRLRAATATATDANSAAPTISASAGAVR